MIESKASPTGGVEWIIQTEMRRDRLVRWVSILSWVITFLVLVGFCFVVGHDASRALALSRAGMLRPEEVLKALVPLFLAVGTTSLLLALVSTAALFLRQRTARLADIQLRLLTLEAALGATADRNGDDVP